jgi:hypothetical protein
VAVVAIWFVSSATATMAAWAKLTPATRSYLHTYWSGGFMPLPPWRAVAAGWPLHALRLLLGHGEAGLQYPIAVVFLVVAVVGLVRIATRAPKAAAVLLAPAVACLVGATLQQYPFEDRLILFVVPILLFGLAEAVGSLAAFLSRASGPPLASTAVVILLVPMLLPTLASLPPYHKEDLRSVLSYVADRREAADAVYVYYGATAAFDYYGARYGLTDAIMGGCHRGQNAEYLKEIDRLRGLPRVWVVFTHVLPQYSERDDIVRYLDAIGGRRDDYVIANKEPRGTPAKPDAEALLYDLRGTGAQSTTSADTFPVTDVGLDARLSC